MADSEFSILTPVGMLGYAYTVEHFWYGIEEYRPEAIIVDSGSTDGGPFKLGVGKMTCGRNSYIRDLEPILAACFHFKIKVLISSVGGDGSDKHLQEMFEIVTEISCRLGFSFEVATIKAGSDRNLVKRKIASSKVHPCGPVEDLLPDVVDGAVDVVSQMGAEPFMEALKGNPDIILAGRSYDPAPFAAFCLSRGVSEGVAWHMGKIMECGAACATPKGTSIIATVRRDSFDLTPLDPSQRCTPLSVASHTLYEKTRPDRLPGPGGILSLDTAKYEQLTEKTTRVSGATFIPTPYQIKLEGVTHLGHRAVFIGGIRDPVLIGQIDDYLERVRGYVRERCPFLDKSEACRLIFHVYGINGVMGPLETQAAGLAHEIAILGEVVAPNQELASTIANSTRVCLLHAPYPGHLATGGNFASPLSPHEQEGGPVFEFSLYHLVDLEEDEQVSLFPVSFHRIKSTQEPSPLVTITEDRKIALRNGVLAPIAKKEVPKGRAKMSSLACVIRSKNAGPFELTFDIMFDSIEMYNRVRDADVLGNDVIRRLYGVEDEDIITNMFYTPALAWKCTIRRPWAQGSIGERDTLGTQQHAPLLNIEVPGTETATPTAIDTKDRSDFLARDIVREIWTGLQLPQNGLKSLELPGDDGRPALPSSYKIGSLAQGTIALSGLTASLFYSLRNNVYMPQVTVPTKHATIEFKSEMLYTLDGKPASHVSGPIGGLHKTSDGYVRIHDAFPNHRDGAARLLGLPLTASRADVSAKIRDWASVDLESVGLDNELAIYALRSYRQWDLLPQAKAIADFPISISQIATGPAGLPAHIFPGIYPCLRGLRVLEMSRGIAAPLAGKTLAVHGADVIWVTSPNLPSLPDTDIDLGRGKRTVQLDLHDDNERQKLMELVKSCDVFIQSFRPGSLAAHGLSQEQVAALNPGVVYASLSAFGPRGPWSGRRGFDSLVQTCSGMNVSEAEHYGTGGVAQHTPCQALDHASGYLLSSGIMAALHRRAKVGGSHAVEVSLAGVMKYLRSLGQYPGSSGFEVPDFETAEDVEEKYLETCPTGFGELRAVRHSVTMKGCKVSWERMPKPPGSDKPEWRV
ncbi:hypothetical protein LA080_013028 [Diaporthe eres]|nr:hypothetical protein LA080_013028 [Diaporthe eres]